MTTGGGFDADHGVIENTAKMLRSGSDSLERLGGSVPSSPDAGELSGHLGSVMSKMVGAAGEISTGASVAAQEVEDGGKAYVETDDAAKRSLPRVQ